MAGKRLPFEPDAAEVEAALQEYLDDLSAAFLPGDRLTAKLDVPSDEAYRQGWETNQTVCATLRLATEKHGHIRDIRLLYPCHGVFVVRSWNPDADEQDRAALKIWRPVLTPALGISFLKADARPPSEKSDTDEEYDDDTAEDYEAGEDADTLEAQDEDVSESDEDAEEDNDSQPDDDVPGIDAAIRLSLCCGWKHNEPLELLPVKQKRKSSRTRKEKKSFQLVPRQLILKQISDLPEIEQTAFGDLKHFFSDPRNAILATPEQKHVCEILRRAADALKAKVGSARLRDRQDIEVQRLDTYAVFIIENIAQLTGAALVQAGDALEALSALDYESRLRKRMRSKTGRRPLVPFEPLNQIGAISDLTAFDRYDRTSTEINNMPISLRQNHPSFEGYICPVETPESGRVGITLHLAAGVTTTVTGKLVKPVGGHGLGYAASLLPFFQHNDGARSMMGAKNYARALPHDGSQPPYILTGNEPRVSEALADLTRVGFLPDNVRGFDQPGRNLIVAYMPWFGYNCSDAIVASRFAAWRMTCTQKVRRSCYIPPGYTLATEDADNTNKQICDWFVTGHETPELSEPLFHQTDTGMTFRNAAGKTLSIPAESFDGLIWLKYHANSPTSPIGGLLEWKVERSYPLAMGDKLAGLHGNKGVICRLSPVMPRLPQDERLGSLAGTSVDIVVNPHGVLSRMNMGQLIEAQWLFLHELAKTKHIQLDVGRAHAPVPHQKLRDCIAAINAGKDPAVIDSQGRMYLTLPDGSQTEAPVLVGIQYFLRLDHIAREKTYTRPGGVAFNRITGQPERTKKREGGQRLGEMEMWALSASNVPNVVEDVLTDRELSAARDDDASQTYRALASHLFASGIVLRQDEGRFKVEWVKDEDVLRRGVAIDCPDTVLDGIIGAFRCGHEECTKTALSEYFTTGGSQRREDAILTVVDVLRHHGMYPQLRSATPANIAMNSEGEMIIQCVLVNKESQACGFVVRRSEYEAHASFGVEGKSYVAYRRVLGSQAFGVDDLLKMWITCAAHTTQRLRCASAHRMRIAAPRGLYDRSLFVDEDETWGYVRLPVPLILPLNLSKSDTPPMLSVLPVLPLRYREREVSGSEGRPKSPLAKLYEKIVVAAWKCAGGGIEGETGGAAKVSKLSKCIAKLQGELQRRVFGRGSLTREAAVGRQIDRSGRYVIVPDPGLGWDECALPLSAVMTLYERGRRESGEASGAKSLQTRAASRHSELVVVHTTDFTQGSYNWKDYTDSDSDAYMANAVEKRLTRIRPVGLIGRQPSLHRYNVKGMLMRLAKYSDILGEDVEVQTFELRNNAVMMVNPLVCNSMGADFDGDTMAAFVVGTHEDGVPNVRRGTDASVGGPKQPGSEAPTEMPVGREPDADVVTPGEDFVVLREEMESLFPSHRQNLLSDADGRPVASFIGELVVGTYLISRNPERRDRFMGKMAVGECGTCVSILAAREWDKGVGEKFMQHLCAAHVDRAAGDVEWWMREAFDAATRHGVSFGFLDLLELRALIGDDVSRLQERQSGLFADGTIRETEKGWEEELERWNAELESVVKNCLRGVLDRGDSRAPGYGIAAIAMSGAKGGDQVTQILGSRGYLSPGDTAWDVRRADFVFRRSLVEGMDEHSAFLAAMNARVSVAEKKLVTARAGTLQRQLVWACWPWKVTEPDCGLPEGHRSAGGCRLGSSRAVCAACYGALPNGAAAPIGYPAGLIAAHSIGERCSQLSMQAFHTGRSGIDVDAVSGMLNPDRKAETWEAVNSDTGCEKFVELMKKVAAFKLLREQHFQLVWRVMRENKEKTLRGAVKRNQEADLFLGLVRSKNQWDFVRQAIREGITSDGSGDWAQIVIGHAGRNAKNGRTS